LSLPLASSVYAVSRGVESTAGEETRRLPPLP